MFGWRFLQVQRCQSCRGMYVSVQSSDLNTAGPKSFKHPTRLRFYSQGRTFTIVARDIRSVVGHDGVARSAQVYIQPRRCKPNKAKDLAQATGLTASYAARIVDQVLSQEESTHSDNAAAPSPVYLPLDKCVQYDRVVGTAAVKPVKYISPGFGSSVGEHSVAVAFMDQSSGSSRTLVCHHCAVTATKQVLMSRKGCFGEICQHARQLCRNPNQHHLTVKAGLYFRQTATKHASTVVHCKSQMGVKRSHAAMSAPEGGETASSPFMPMFEQFRQELDEHHERRERIIKASRDVTAASKKMYGMIASWWFVAEPC